MAILPSVLLRGLGFALALPSINVQATAGVSNQEQGLAADLVQTSTQVGAAVVLAVTTAAVTGGMPDTQATPVQMLRTYRPGLVLSVAAALAGLAVAAWPRSRRVRTLVSPATEPERDREPVA